MNGKLLIAVIALMLLINGTLITIALRKNQNKTTAPNTIVKPSPSSQTSLATTPEKTTALEKCFTYYDYGKISVQLTSDKADYNPGEDVVMHGQIVNDNTFPLRDLILYAHIRRKNETTYQDSGHFLIDKMTLLEDFSLQAKEKKEISLTIPFADTYPKGDYRIQYYVLSQEGFHYGGRSFLEEDFAGASELRWHGPQEPVVYFDIDNLMVNGERHAIRENIYEYPAGPISFDISIISNPGSPATLPATVALYSFEDDRQDKLITEEPLTIVNGRLQYTFTPTEPGAYVLVASIDAPVASILKYRFASLAAGAPELRMNDLGSTDFPIRDTSRAWVCFHSSSRAPTENTQIRLSLLNSNQTVEATTEYTGIIDGDVYAISLPMRGISTPQDFWIETTFINPSNQNVLSTAKKHFSCDLFAETLTKLDMKYLVNKPEEIQIEAYNSCNKRIVKDIVINSFSLSKGNDILLEQTNTTLDTPIISVGKLEPGTYKASLTAQHLNKSILIVVPEKNIFARFNSIYGLIALIIIIIATASTVIVFRSKKI